MADDRRLEISMSDESVLRELNDEKSRQYIGLVVYVALVGILGISGNAIALVFYMKQKKKTDTTILIISLTIIDLLMSFYVFKNIYDFSHTLTFASNAWCKLYHFIGHFLTMNSLLFLIAIGFDRFVLIYQWPHWPKVICQISSTKFLICACVTMSTVIAHRGIWLAELTQVDVHVMSINRTITGARCMYSRQPELKGIITLFHMLDLSILVSVLIFVIVIYSLIARKVASVRKHLGDYTKHSRLQAPNVYTLECGQHNTINLSECTTDRSQQVEATEKVHVISVSSTEDNTISTSQIIQNVDKQLQSSNKSKRNKYIEKRITIMIFVITAASLLSFVPFSVISLLQTYDHTSSAWEVLAHRSYLINSTLNPFIIGFFNSEFRRFIVDRVMCCRRRLLNS